MKSNITLTTDGFLQLETLEIMEAHYTVNNFVLFQLQSLSLIAAMNI